MGDESPKNKVKFLCSYGGKVLPRPSDGVLKYVGGETRVICVPRDVTLSEMMKKVSVMVDGDVVLKYLLVPEELDTLVSVRTQEDLKHMIQEHDRHESGGSPLLRAFLFPSKPLVIESQNQLQLQLQSQSHPLSLEPYFLEQRYIDAINGIIRTSPRAKFSTRSACSSPKSISPDGHTTTESPFQGSQQLQSRTTMQRVRSSPSLSNLNTQASTQFDHGVSSSHYHHHHPLISTFRPIQEQGMGMGMGRPPQMNMNMNMNMITTDSNSNNNNMSGSRGMSYYYSTNNRPHNKPYAYHDDSTGHVMVERVHSIPRSPRMSIWE
ncbi:uncharacterized protein [Cicer arietinum]|uniref:Uncharacterized protein LOC101498970 n=1 Tax=Cicer arietinum TaxID=3827 RepID=A0A1S2XBL7_CICAR|nr:uncharacterized protein LOC101498970 [Cicer arietinum]